jgi:hypothetical protein
MRPEHTAFTVSERIDALAAALRDAGVPEEQRARVLAAAATAALHAVTLDAVLAERYAPTRQAGTPGPARGEIGSVGVEAATALAAE